MGPLVEFMLDKGVNEETIVLLLMVPLLTTLVSAARYFIGIKSYGIFTPILLSIAYAMISNDVFVSLLYGLTISGAAIIGSFAIQYVLDVNKYKVFRMHYLPKLGIIITSISIGLIIMLLIAASIDKNFASIEPLPLLLTIMLVESFATKAFKKGFKTALGVSIETILLTALGTFVIASETIRSILLSNPEAILLTLPVNFIIGKFAGLRLRELTRFTEVEETEE